MTSAPRDLLELGQVNPPSADEGLMTNLPVELHAESTGGGEEILAQISVNLKSGHGCALGTADGNGIANVYEAPLLVEKGDPANPRPSSPHVQLKQRHEAMLTDFPKLSEAAGSPAVSFTCCVQLVRDLTYMYAAPLSKPLTDALFHAPTMAWYSPLQ